MTIIRSLRLIFFSTLSLGCVLAAAQTPAPAPEPPPDTVSHGTVLFERHADDAALAPAPAPADQTGEAKLSGSALSDEERSALTITRYDLDARLLPSSSQLEMRARLSLRNDSATPLTRIALQISSTLTWQSAALLDASHTRLTVVQHLVETDADHTGKSNELVLQLPQPLAAGKSLAVDTFYSGTITASGERLERIGATAPQALAADWDTISPGFIALRGFGNVLWYPVASPQLFLGDGARLFQAIGASRLREEAATVQLRLGLAYRGEPPAAVYFCGRRARFSAISDDADSPIATGTGLATAQFPAATLGFRPISLIVAEQPEVLVAPLSTGAGPASEDLLAVETAADATLPRLADSALAQAPLLQQWFGPHPLSALTLFDHDGQPFEDGPLVVAPVDTLAGSSAATVLAQSLTHAWVQTGQPWLDEGLAQFIALLSIEHLQGRDVAHTALNGLMRPVALAEPAPQLLNSDTAGQPLISATDELYYRRKAAAVFWMLRSLVGDTSLQAALTILRSQPPSTASASDQALAFEKLLEKISHKDLGWFFADWVLRDRGLPDLTIAEVTPRQLPAGKGHDTGWLVAVTVRNDGAAAAEVPLVIRSGTFSVTRQMRIPGLASATERVIVEAPPTQVVLNDGATPEITASERTLNVTVQR